MISDYRPPLQADLRRMRRTMGETSPAHFAKIYLGALCFEPFSRMHQEMFQELERLIRQRGGRLAIAAPRGHAKSTIVTLAFVLWCVLYRTEKLILLISATKEQAQMLLKHIKEQLQQNVLLLEDFPDACAPEGAKGRAKPWRESCILLRNQTMIHAYGAGQNLRGARHGKERPGLIVVDDLEDQEHVIVEEQREKLSQWFNATLLHAGHPDTNIIVVGTILHHDSLLANLTGSKSTWRKKIY